MFSDLDTLDPASLKKPKGPACSVCRLLADSEPDDAERIRKALGDPRWTFKALSDYLFKHGIRISAGTLGRHASGGCEAKEILRVS